VARVCELLEPYALGDHITLAQEQGGRGQPLQRLSVVCAQQDVAAVAAALLAWTPATHISACAVEQLSLPQLALPVTTPYGQVDVQLSLAGSRVCKVTPAWSQCQDIAAAAKAAHGSGGASGAAGGGGGAAAAAPDAQAVAAAAVAALHAGMQDGSIQLHMQSMY
jgi:hypothetical protein